MINLFVFYWFALLLTLYFVVVAAAVAVAAAFGFRKGYLLFSLFHFSCVAIFSLPVWRFSENKE